MNKDKLKVSGRCLRNFLKEYEKYFNNSGLFKQFIFLWMYLN